MRTQLATGKRTQVHGDAYELERDTRLTRDTDLFRLTACLLMVARYRRALVSPPATVDQHLC